MAETLSAAKGEGGEVTDAVERVATGFWRHPRELGTAEVRGFLTHLAVERNVAVSPYEPLRNCWGDAEVSTTQVYTHVMARPGIGVRSPLD